MPVLSETFDSLEVGTPIGAAHLTRVPLLAPAPAAPDCLPLDAVPDAGLADLTGFPDDGAVSALACRNGAENHILHAGGEELVGAKRNGVLNLTAPVAARIAATPQCAEPAVATDADLRIEGDGLHAKGRIGHLGAFCADTQTGP